ncbi:isochorismatase [Aphanothece hegewaldii CCALA 016]|uniref:Isochorismatase n=1 Tax=Aphanothece hegewaldii CCALA 016 TaxID=2107694 RepID=A0A2T1LZM4_9CHRO|nr:cysteine hydrolase family protein [Aphanothece hegewaldii]PSF37874.1 isochorismatase [Aphanothece hegewaldii CCALA 016]
MTTNLNNFLPIPSFFDSQKVYHYWAVPYHERAREASEWAKKYNIKPAYDDKNRICLLIIDAQNTFCLPEFELFVGGRSGRGAIDDNIRLCEFIYRNLKTITTIIPTMDTHTAIQIFHPIFWVNEAGENPQPMTMISYSDVENKVWRVNPALGNNLDNYALHYVQKISEQGKYLLTIWPYHSMLGGIGHALVSALEEAIFFHSIARKSQTQFELKGENILTENYSVFRPEILDDHQGQPITQKNSRLLQQVLDYDAVIIAGQAKSHCVAWTIEDLLKEIMTRDPNLAKKVYLLEDCTSPVVVPGVVDFTPQADAAFQRFAENGMNIVRSNMKLADFSFLKL